MADPEHVELARQGTEVLNAWVAENPDVCLDLSGADLEGVDLTGAILRGANLQAAFLAGTCLARADLSGANLAGAILAVTDLTGADLTGANLGDADVGIDVGLEGAKVDTLEVPEDDASRAAPSAGPSPSSEVDAGE